MILRGMLAVAYATGRASHVRQVKGDDQDKKGYTSPPSWGLDVRLTTPPRKIILLRNLKEMKLDGYLSKYTMQYAKFCGSRRRTN
jgi:hypothetical protein